METDTLATQYPLGAKVLTPTGLKAHVIEQDFIKAGKLAGMLWAIVVEVETADEVIHRLVYNRMLLQQGHLRPYREPARSLIHMPNWKNRK